MLQVQILKERNAREQSTTLWVKEQTWQRNYRGINYTINYISATQSLRSWRSLIHIKISLSPRESVLPRATGPYLGPDDSVPHIKPYSFNRNCNVNISSMTRSSVYFAFRLFAKVLQEIIISVFHTFHSQFCLLKNENYEVLHCAVFCISRLLSVSFFGPLYSSASSPQITSVNVKDQVSQLYKTSLKMDNWYRTDAFS
jgi:hypothetical protein